MTRLKRACVGIGAIGVVGMLCVVDSAVPLKPWLMTLGFFLGLTLLGAAGAWLCGEGRRG